MLSTWTMTGSGPDGEAFETHLAAGPIAVAGERITNPAPAPKPTDVAIMLDPV